jgi:signal transduction histidine kinase
MDLSALVGALETLVVERLPGGRFVRRGVVPAWGLGLASAAIREDAPFAIEAVFPFLEAFLEQAEEAWRARPSGRACSGFWTETGAAGEEIHLEATAVCVGDAEVLAISRSERLFHGQEVVLQRARELRLIHRALMREMEQKDVLLHTIVHELAGPLHTVLGMLSLLDETALQPVSAAGWVDSALQAATSQRQLIAGVLEVFSAERDAASRWAEPSARAPDVCSALERVVSDLEPQARRRDVRLTSQSCSPPCRVVGEDRRLLRVLTNLVEGAIQNSPRGGDVRTTVRPERGWVWVTVADQGPVLPTEVRRHVFEKLSGERDRNLGARLGLYFCRITVESWGGEIGYEPVEPGGARFWIRLRVAERAGGCRGALEPGGPPAKTLR